MAAEPPTPPSPPRRPPGFSIVLQDCELVLSLPLPPELAIIPLVQQLAAMKRVIQERRRYKGDGPLTPSLWHELRVTPTLSLHLSPEGDFTDLEAGKAVTDARVPSRNCGRSRRYVIGRRAEGFCWLLPDQEGDQADDQDLDGARRFESLAAAVQAAAELDLSVFEVVLENGHERLDELTVDLALVESLPYRGCYRVSDLLLAGPMFVTESSVTTLARVTALSQAKVWGIVSLVDRGELFWMQSGLDSLAFQHPFRQHYFPVQNGEAPSRPQMRVILDVVDEMVEAGHRVFVHCLAGRGRTGAVVGCWLARHREPNAPPALDELARLRYLHGLFQPSPETEAQREIVRNWRKDE